RFDDQRHPGSGLQAVTAATREKSSKHWSRRSVEQLKCIRLNKTPEVGVSMSYPLYDPRALRV
ncbi:MAG: hypothetical protein KJ884_04500, partial [Gammaproteobacteria bacterium]|nr:hypothetical protein [Gammaproteobacteria bacterium]